MENSEATSSAPSAKDQPAPTLSLPGGPSGQASPRLTLGPVILPPEQGLSPTVFLKALPIPLYHTVPPGGLQPRAPLVTGSLDGGGVPFILSPLFQPEGPGPSRVGKPAPPALTVNIVGTLPVLSPGLGSTLGSPGKVRNAGKHLCPHCGRDCLKPSVLEKHIRSHTGERPFPCSTCGIAFKTQSNLYKHRRTQTHLNNCRLSLESEGGGSSLLEDGDRPGESSSADSRGDEGGPERSPSPGAHPTLTAKTLETKAEAASCAGYTLIHREVPGPATTMTSPGLTLASPQSRRKLPESKPCSLQRQQEMCPEKPGDARASEGRLRKCESTDSGYLSRSDSAEQPAVASSPLHSLSERSAGWEGEGEPGPKAEPVTPRSSLELEKKRLEERITQLISHNQAVVDDPQLGHVRPRKTVLSKQGSIDLPMPYTYKDSFHFDIRALEPSRRRAVLSPACSTFTPLDKSRPLFFHSVPTQLSTSVECVPVTRSNSLPFIESSKMWPEPRDLQVICPRMGKPLSPRLTPARLGHRSGLTLADTPSGHPRALVRQAAIEDLPCTPTGDPSAPAENLDGKRVMAVEGASKGRGGKKYGLRKTRMFSQEKWQVYGNETFKRIYQKMKTSHQGGQKARAEQNLPPQAEAAQGKGAALSHESRTSVLGDISEKVKPEFWEGQPAPQGALEAKSPQKMKAVGKVEGSDHSGVARAEASPTLSSRDPPCLGSRSPLLPPSGRLDPGCQLPPAPRSIQREDLGIPRLALPDLQVEGDIPGDGGTKDACSGAQIILRRSSGDSGEPIAEDKLPSERKKLKVEGLNPQEQPGPHGTETIGSSSPPAKQDSDLREMPGGPREHAQKGVAPLESSGISSTVSAAVPAGPGNKETPWRPDARVPRYYTQLATQPQAPSVLAAQADGTFAPKYLLRLPQGETSSPSATPGPGQGRDSLCTSARTGPGSGTPWSSTPLSGPAPSELDSTLKDPSWSRSGDGKDEAPSTERTDTSAPVTRDSPKSAKQDSGEIASILPTCTCDAHMVQDIEGGTHSTHHLGTNSLRGPGASGGLLNPCSSTGKLGLSPDNAPKGMPSEPRAGLSSSCPLQTCCFLKALPRPQVSLSPQFGSPRSWKAPSSFPSLKAEPQLTWCCLSRSLPLPTEQEKETSGHWSLPSPGGSRWDERGQLPPKSRGGGVSRCGGGEPRQTPQVSYVTVPGMRPQDSVSDPQRKKGLCHRRRMTSRGSSKQKRRRLLLRRYQGSFWYSRVQLRGSRLRRPPWVLRRSHPTAPLQVAEPRGRLRRTSSEMAGLNLQGETSCTSAKFPLGHGNGKKEEEDHRPISEPRTSSRTIREIDKSALKAISPSAGERGAGSHEEEAVHGSGSSVQLSPRLAVSLPQDKGPDVGLLGIQLLSSQDRVSIDPKSCVITDVQGPSSFESKGTFPGHDIATSAAALCIPLGTGTGPRILGMHSTEPQEHSWDAGETLTQSSPDRKGTAESTPQALLPGKPSPGQKMSGLAPSGSPETTPIERPTPGSCSSSFHQEGRPQADFSSRGQYGFGPVATPSSIFGGDDEKCLASGLITAKGCAASPAPEKPLEVLEVNSRSIRKRSLEGMRKQTRVELSDTSSDDEDRLVIEM